MTEPSQEREDPARRLVAFLAWAGPVAAAVCVASLVVALTFGPRRLLATAVANGAWAACSVLARGWARRGRADRAALLLAGAMLAVDAAHAAFFPGLYGGPLLTTLLAPALALPYVAGRQLRWLFVGSFATAVWMAVAAHALPQGPALPVPHAVALAVGATAPACGLLLLSLWHYRLRLTQTLAHTRRSEARFRSLVLAAAQVVWTADAEGLVREDAPSWRAFTGMRPGEMLGEGWLAAVHPEERARVARAWREAVRARVPLEDELRLGRAEGGWAWVRVRSVPVLNEDGTVREWMGSFRDVSERRRAAEREQLVLDATALLVGSLEPGVTLANVARMCVPLLADWCAVEVAPWEGQAAERMAFVPGAPAAGAGAGGVSGAGEGAGSGEGAGLRARLADGYGRLAVVRRVREAGRPEFHWEVAPAQLEALGGPGEGAALLGALGVRALLVLPLNARGRTLGVLTLAYDGSGRSYVPADARAAQELAGRAALALDNVRLYQEAQEAVRVRDAFLQVAGHELRTPLTPLQLHVKSMLRGLPRSGLTPPPVGEGLPLGPEQLVTKLESMDRQVARLTRLVGELLDVSRITSGRLELRREPVDLVQLVRELEAAFREEAARAGCALEVRAPPELPGLWDRSRLEQVLTNLVSNALKYGRGRPVRLTLGAREDAALLEVSDEGIGIPGEAHARIFGRFERAVSERHYGGLGLGLWICRQIVDAHGGSIGVRSAPGAGSTFTVTLPREQPPGELHTH
jgi:PAS domain S-box-containing protein